MTTGRINQIAFVEKGAGTTDRFSRRVGTPACSNDKVFASVLSHRYNREARRYRDGRGVLGLADRALRDVARFTGLRGSERSPSCVRCLRPRCGGRRSGPSRRLTVRLDVSDNGLGTALPFPGVARLPEADASRPGGRSVAIEHERETCVGRVSVEVTKAFAVSLRGSRPTSLPTDGTGVVTL